MNLSPFDVERREVKVGHHEYCNNGFYPLWRLFLTREANAIRRAAMSTTDAATIQRLHGRAEGIEFILSKDGECLHEAIEEINSREREDNERNARADQATAGGGPGGPSGVQQSPYQNTGNQPVARWKVGVASTEMPILQPVRGDFGETDDDD